MSNAIIPTQWAEMPAFIYVIIIIFCILYRFIANNGGNKHGMMYNKINNNSYYY